MVPFCGKAELITLFQPFPRPSSFLSVDCDFQVADMIRTARLPLTPEFLITARVVKAVEDIEPYLITRMSSRGSVVWDAGALDRDIRGGLSVLVKFAVAGGLDGRNRSRSSNCREGSKSNSNLYGDPE